MEPRVRKLWSGLALGVVMAVPGAANAPSLAATARLPLAASAAVPLAGPGPGPGAVPGPRPIAVVARQFPGNGASSGWPRPSAAGSGAAWSGERMKTYALVLSLFGMLGMVVWHRLTRSF